jgi:hypothetical protein
LYTGVSNFDFTNEVCNINTGLTPAPAGQRLCRSRAGAVCQNMQ